MSGAYPGGFPASFTREIRDRMAELFSLISLGVKGPAARSDADPLFRAFSPRHLSQPRGNYVSDSDGDWRLASRDEFGVRSPVLAGSFSPPVVHLAIFLSRTLWYTLFRVLTPSFTFIKICLLRMDVASFWTVRGVVLPVIPPMPPFALTRLAPRGIFWSPLPLLWIW